MSSFSPDKPINYLEEESFLIQPSLETLINETSKPTVILNLFQDLIVQIEI